tara:strand:+ start:158 stop:328 length:171 start_codon:yes stop_codon:yes gene_type:complete
VTQILISLWQTFVCQSKKYIDILGDFIIKYRIQFEGFMQGWELISGNYGSKARVNV